MTSDKRKRRIYRSEEGYDAADLLRYAVDHREAALLLFRTGFEFHDSAAYLAHVSVELLLKALVLHLTGQFCEGHSLSSQLREVEAANSSLGLAAAELPQLALLDSASDVRYPHPRAPKQVGHSHRDALIAIWDRVSTSLPPELQGRFDSQPADRKGGRVLMIKRLDLQEPGAAPE